MYSIDIILSKEFFLKLVFLIFLRKVIFVCFLKVSEILELTFLIFVSRETVFLRNFSLKCN
jgi:hypothetical protein